MAQTNKKFRISQEVRDQILRRIKEDGVSVVQAAEEHGISTHTIYRWLTKGASSSPSWSEIAKLKKENKALLELVGEITVKLSQAQKKS
jgi:transposase-like protein